MGSLRSGLWVINVQFSVSFRVLCVVIRRSRGFGY